MELIFSGDQATRVLAALEHEYFLTESPAILALINYSRAQIHKDKEIYLVFPLGIKDIDFLIMYMLSDADLFKVCTLNRYTADLCREETFWLKKLENKYNINFLPYVKPQLTAKQIYRDLGTIKNDKKRLEYVIKHGITPLVLKNLEKNGYYPRLLSLAVTSGDLDLVKLVNAKRITFLRARSIGENPDKIIRLIRRAIKDKRLDIADYLATRSFGGTQWHLVAKEYIKQDRPDLLQNIIETLSKQPFIKKYDRTEDIPPLLVLSKKCPQCSEVLAPLVTNLDAFVDAYQGNFAIPQSIIDRLSAAQKAKIKTKEQKSKPKSRKSKAPQPSKEEGSEGLHHKKGRPTTKASESSEEESSEDRPPRKKGRPVKKALELSEESSEDLPSRKKGRPVTKAPESSEEESSEDRPPRKKGHQITKAPESSEESSEEEPLIYPGRGSPVREAESSEEESE